MLGNAKEIASNRLEYSWQCLERDLTKKILYTEFLSKYELLNHIEEIRETNDVDEGYLPHHGILRPSSKTTKLSVVFDASVKTTIRNYLNYLLCKGGILHEDFSLH